MGHNNNNSGLLWGTIITIVGFYGETWVQKYNKGVVLITIRGYTSNVGA